MSRSKRLTPLVEVAARRIEESAQAVAAARALLATEETRLADLVEYRRQYDQWPARTEPTHSFSLANSRAFGAQLDEAIRLQEIRVHDARTDVERRLEEWSELRKHARAIEQLADRYLSEEQRAAARVEQRQSDDSGLSRRIDPRSKD